MPRFQWLADGVEMPELNTEALEKWIIEVAASHDRIVGPMTYIFCSDEKMLEVNRQFLNHDYFTDIITFDDSRGKLVTGDIFISLPMVEYNAGQFGQSPQREFHRVLIHGLLHLCGINDKGPGEREIMERNEDEALALLPSSGNTKL